MSLIFRGFLNFIICFIYGLYMIWWVFNLDYFKYDKINLYNINLLFDDGFFKVLEEKYEFEFISFELFVYRFDIEGVYVFMFSVNLESIMVSLDFIYKR